MMIHYQTSPYIPRTKSRPPLRKQDLYVIFHHRKYLNEYLRKANKTSYRELYDEGEHSEETCTLAK